MKKLTIFEVYVLMTSQEQCDRMKQVCVDNGLDYWNGEGFDFYKGKENYFTQSHVDSDFLIFVKDYHDRAIKNKQEITEAEFLQLLKEYKDV